jgi:hypothetical protein
VLDEFDEALEDEAQAWLAAALEALGGEDAEE